MLKKTHEKTQTHQNHTPSHQGVVKIQQKQQQKTLLHLWGRSVAIAPILPLVCG